MFSGIRKQRADGLRQISAHPLRAVAFCFRCMAVSFARHRIAALRSTITKIDNRRQVFTASYYIGWAVLLLAFVAIGGRELWIGSHGNFIERGPFASTDAYLEALLNV